MPRPRTLVTLLVLAALVTVALPTAPAQASQDAATPTETAAAATDVRVFQNGLAAVRQTVDVAPGGGTTRVPLDLPPGVLFDTVRVAGEKVLVQEVRLPANATTAGPAPGDPVTVQTTKGLVAGTLVDAGDPVAVESGNETVFVPRAQVVTISVPATAEAGEPAPRAVAVVEAPAAPTRLTLTYLVQGPQWRPVYDLDPRTGALSMSGLVEDAPFVTGANLSLVAGQPHTAMPVEPIRPFAEEAVALDAAAAPAPMERAPEQFTAAPEGTFEVFHLERPVDLRPGQALRLPIAEANLTVVERRLDVDAFVGGFAPAPAQEEPLPALERVQVRNTGDFLLPEGVVNFVRAGAWVGSDALPFTAVNGTANLTVSTATRVDARLVALSAEPTAQGTRVVQAVRVTNHGADAADVRVTVHHPLEDFRVLSTQPNATRVAGGEVVWDLEVPPGATRSAQLTYEVIQPR